MSIPSSCSVIPQSVRPSTTSQKHASYRPHINTSSKQVVSARTRREQLLAYHVAVKMLEECAPSSPQSDRRSSDFFDSVSTAPDARLDTTIESLRQSIQDFEKTHNRVLHDAIVLDFVDAQGKVVAGKVQSTGHPDSPLDSSTIRKVHEIFDSGGFSYFQDKRREMGRRHVPAPPEGSPLPSLPPVTDLGLNAANSFLSINTTERFFARQVGSDTTRTQDLHTVREKRITACIREAVQSHIVATEGGAMKYVHRRHSKALEVSIKRCSDKDEEEDNEKSTAKHFLTFENWLIHHKSLRLAVEAAIDLVVYVLMKALPACLFCGDAEVFDQLMQEERHSFTKTAVIPPPVKQISDSEVSQSDVVLQKMLALQQKTSQRTERSLSTMHANRLFLLIEVEQSLFGNNVVRFLDSLPPAQLHRTGEHQRTSRTASASSISSPRRAEAIELERERRKRESMRPPSDPLQAVAASSHSWLSLTTARLRQLPIHAATNSAPLNCVNEDKRDETVTLSDDISDGSLRPLSGSQPAHRMRRHHNNAVTTHEGFSSPEPTILPIVDLLSVLSDPSCYTSSSATLTSNADRLQEAVGPVELRLLLELASAYAALVQSLHGAETGTSYARFLERNCDRLLRASSQIVVTGAIEYLEYVISKVDGSRGLPRLPRGTEEPRDESIDNPSKRGVIDHRWRGVLSSLRPFGKKVELSKQQVEAVLVSTGQSNGSSGGLAVGNDHDAKRAAQHLVEQNRAVLHEVISRVKGELQFLLTGVDGRTRLLEEEQIAIERQKLDRKQNRKLRESRDTTNPGRDTVQPVADPSTVPHTAVFQPVGHRLSISRFAAKGSDMVGTLGKERFQSMLDELVGSSSEDEEIRQEHAYEAADVLRPTFDWQRQNFNDHNRRFSTSQRRMNAPTVASRTPTARTPSALATQERHQEKDVRVVKPPSKIIPHAPIFKHDILPNNTHLSPTATSYSRLCATASRQEAVHALAGLDLHKPPRTVTDSVANERVQTGKPGPTHSLPRTLSVASSATLDEAPLVKVASKVTRVARHQRTSMNLGAVSTAMVEKARSNLKAGEGLAMLDLQQELLELERDRRRASKSGCSKPVTESTPEMPTTQPHGEESVTASVVGAGAAVVVEKFKRACNGTIQFMYGAQQREGTTWYEQGRPCAAARSQRVAAIRGVQQGRFDLGSLTPIAALRLAVSTTVDQPTLSYTQRTRKDTSNVAWTL